MARIAILLEQKYEDLELQYPRLRLIEAGHQVEVIAPKLGEKYLGKWGYPQAADKASKDAHARDFGGLLRARRERPRRRRERYLRGIACLCTAGCCASCATRRWPKTS